MTTAEMLRKEGEERGRKLGRAEALLGMLASKGLPVSEELRERILDCEDLALLDRWIARATTAKSAAEVVGE